MKTAHCLFLTLLLGAILFVGPPAVGQLLPPEEPSEDVRESVVKIHTTARLPSLFQPWRKENARESTGTGVIINDRQVLTNAHVVAYGTQVYIQPYQSADKIAAKVVAFAPGVDLALLELEEQDPEFFAQRPPLVFAQELPPIRGDVSAFGYPVGGTDLSVTRGIVSRIEVASYKHSHIGLRIQVDAALNPGNSGGPALMNGEIVGLVFSGIGSADNIGYLIPVPEIMTFLQDAEDGSYQGKPEIQVGSMQTLENPALRAKLGLDSSVTGMLVTNKPAGLESPLEPWDVVTHIGPHDIDNEGNCPIRSDLRGDFRYFVDDVADEQGMVELSVVRGGEPIKVKLQTYIEPAALMPAITRHNDYPRYFIYGPLCFSQVSDEMASSIPAQYIQVLNFIDSPLVTRMGDRPAFEGEELVIVAAPMFDHPLTKGYDRHHLAILSKINGRVVTNLESVGTILRDLDDAYVIFEFAGRVSETLVFKRSEVEAATEDILGDNGIRYQASPDLRHLLPQE
ncbi:MAG: trypsin-like peptidase domain-containing protein [Planctomycetota bacterium]